MNEIQLWFCDICNKPSKINSKSKRFISKTHVHKKNYGDVVKEHEIIEPEIDTIDYTNLMVSKGSIAFPNLEISFLIIYRGNNIIKCCIVGKKKKIKENGNCMNILLVEKEREN